MLITLYDLGLSSQEQGDLAGAAHHLDEGLALAAGARDLSSVAYYLEELAAVKPYPRGGGWCARPRGVYDR
jgi:hypothetical protein